MRAFLFALTTLMFLSACSNSPRWRAKQAIEILQTNQFQSEILSTVPFKLFSASPTDQKKSDILSVVIEGDGYAWADKYTVSNNPTPKKPTGLKIAIRENSIYLARPCQYVDDTQCNKTYWSFKRFAPEVIQSFDYALTLLKDRYNAKEIHLSGFSGGAYIALNLAAQRTDVKHVTTYAGVLDPDAWTQFHDISALELTHPYLSLIQSSASTSFTHYCGLRDKVVPCTLSQKMTAYPNHSLSKISGASHSGF